MKRLDITGLCSTAMVFGEFKLIDILDIFCERLYKACDEQKLVVAFDITSAKHINDRSKSFEILLKPKYKLELVIVYDMFTNPTIISGRLITNQGESIGEFYTDRTELETMNYNEKKYTKYVGKLLSDMLDKGLTT